MRPIEQVIVRGIPVGRVTGIRLLATGEHLPYEVNFEVHEQSAAGGDPLGELLHPGARRIRCRRRRHRDRLRLTADRPQNSRTT